MSAVFFLNLRQLFFRSLARGRFGTQGALTLRLAMLRRASLKKILNFLSIKIQKRRQVEVVSGLPYRYKVDPTNVCQLHCPLCPTGLNHDFRAKGFLDISKFESLLDQISKSALVLDLFGWGEPMMHPQISQIIDQASRRGIFVRLSTTLHGTSADQLASLVQGGLEAMIVAVDGRDNRTHSQFRAGGDLDQVLASLRELVFMKRAAGTRKPHITVRMLVNRTNENQVQQVSEMVRELGVDAFTVGAVAINTQDSDQAKLWLPRESRISAYPTVLRNTGACEDLWEAMVVNWDGGLAPCCWQYHSEDDIGNAFEKPVAELWNSPNIRLARRIVSGKELNGPFESSICHRCQGSPDYLGGG